MDIIIYNFVLQILFSVGIIAFAGLLIGALNKAFYKILGRSGKAVCVATGLIGTPVHELGHAFFCVIFGHKIVEIKLYQPNNRDDSLGYVNHTFNKKNIYHQIGNFFIGIGPIILGCAVIAILFRLLLPNLFMELSSIINRLSISDNRVYDNNFRHALGVFSGAISIYFKVSSISNPLWWLFMLISSSIALHMKLSVADIKASVVGFFFIVFLLVITNIVLYFVNIKYIWAITNICLKMSSFCLQFLAISISLYIVLIGLAAIIRGVMRLTKKLKIE